MARIIVATLLLAMALSTSEADDNHQEQTFGTCGHHLTLTQCDTYAKANGFATGVAAATDADDKPYGCYKIPRDDSKGVALSFVFNTDSTAKTTPVLCSADNRCICDKLVGAFDTSTVTCHTDGFEPTFTYNPNTQIQDVTIDIKLGTGQTNGNADSKCNARVTGTTDSNTVATKTNFDSSWSTKIDYGTLAQPQCGGAFAHWTDDKGTADNDADDVKYIRYQIDAEAIVTRKFRTQTIQRQRKFTFKIECLLERKLSASSTESFTVAAALINANEQETASNEFAFTAAIKFYEDDTYTGSAKSAAFEVNNNAKVFAQVEKGDNQDLFVFSVQKCYATLDVSGDLSSYSGVQDDFFVDECPVDETVDFSTDNGDFRFEVQAFSFTTSSAAGVFIHCDLLVCLSNDNADCAQKTLAECTNTINNNRRRRDITYRSLSSGTRKETITSTQAILLEGSQFHAPRCGNGFVYDRVSQECSRSNLIEVKGIHLADDVFKDDYHNTSSKAFKDMAKEKEYLLWVLIMATGQSKTLRGVQVIKAAEGSVILDVVVKHSDNVTPKQASDVFKQVIETPATTTRVQNILQITNKESIEYVPVFAQNNRSDPEKLILIVVVAALFVVVFVAGVTLFKVRDIRRQASNPQPTAGFENKGIDA